MNGTIQPPRACQQFKVEFRLLFGKEFLDCHSSHGKCGLLADNG
jgi:hypothetical protein